MGLKKIHLDITGQCNLSCIYCFVTQRDASDISEMSKEALFQIIRDAKDAGIKEFAISGGEPMKNPDIFHVLDLCGGDGYSITLFTNLIMSSESDIYKLSSYESLKEIVTSLDGFDGHNHSRPPSRWEQVVDKIKLIKKVSSETKITVNTIITKFNVGELQSLMKLLTSLSVNHWRIDFPLKNSRRDIYCDFEKAIRESAALIKLRYARQEFRRMDLSIFKIYKSSLEKLDFSQIENIVAPDAHPCEYAKDGIAIRPDGSYSVCPPFVYSLGNMLEEGGFTQAINNYSGHPFFNLKLTDINNCISCRYFQLCGTGCRADAFSWTGNYSKADPISCATMPLIEDIILPVLPHQMKELYKRCINPDGIIPRVASSQSNL